MKNIFSAVSHIVKNGFAIISSESPITINGPADYSKLPEGFFRCRAGDMTTIGYNPPSIIKTETDDSGKPITYKVASPFGFSWDTRGIVRMPDGKVVRLDTAPRTLPLVCLNFPHLTPAGMARISGHIVMDTETLLGQSDGAVEWDGTASSTPSGW